MAAFAYDLRRDFMDGIGELIRRWLKSEPGRTDSALADAVGVAGATVGRWRKEENVPEDENLPQLAEALGVDLAVVEEAAAVSRKVRLTRPASGSSTSVLVNLNEYILTKEGEEEWIEAVRSDESMTPLARRILVTFVNYTNGPINRADIAWTKLQQDYGFEHAEIQEAWPEILRCEYVRRVALHMRDFVFMLKTPD